MSLFWELHQECSRIIIQYKRTSQPPVELLAFYKYISSKPENIYYQVNTIEDIHTLDIKEQQINRMMDLLDSYSSLPNHLHLTSILRLPLKLKSPDKQLTTLIEILNGMQEALNDRSESRISKIIHGLQSESKRLASIESKKMVDWLNQFSFDQQFRLLCSLIRWTNPQLLSDFCIHANSLDSLKDITSNTSKQYNLSQSYYHSYENLAFNFGPRWIRPIDFDRWVNCLPSGLETIFDKTIKNSVEFVFEYKWSQCLHKRTYLSQLIAAFQMEDVLSNNVAKIECMMTSFVKDFKAGKLKDNFVKHIALPRMIISLLATINHCSQYSQVLKKKTSHSFFKLFNECQMVTLLISHYKAHQHRSYHRNPSLQKCNWTLKIKHEKKIDSENPVNKNDPCHFSILGA